MAASKNKPFVFFFLAIIAISLFMFMIQLRGRRVPRLSVPGNRGIAELFTVNNRLTAVFQDGRTCVWDWDDFETRQADFMAGSGRAAPLADGQIVAISRLANRRLLSIYDLGTGNKVNDLTAGRDEQDIHLRNSHNLAVPVLMRRNPERAGAVEVEFIAVNLAAELLRPPALLTLDPKKQTIREFIVCDTGVVVAAGGDDGRARLIAIDLNTGQTLWDSAWPDAEELTSVAVSRDGQLLWVGTRAGNLLTVASADGQRLGKVSLLEPGETRRVTNDFSVLNLVVSPDGNRLGCTIAPVAYAVDAETGRVTHRYGDHKVVSKVAFSPDSRRMATADLRADGVIRFRTLE